MDKKKIVKYIALLVLIAAISFLLPILINLFSSWMVQKVQGGDPEIRTEEKSSESTQTLDGNRSGEGGDSDQNAADTGTFPNGNKQKPDSKPDSQEIMSEEENDDTSDKSEEQLASEQDMSEKAESEKQEIDSERNNEQKTREEASDGKEGSKANTDKTISAAEGNEKDIEEDRDRSAENETDLDSPNSSENSDDSENVKNQKSTENQGNGEKDPGDDSDTGETNQEDNTPAGMESTPLPDYRKKTQPEIKSEDQQLADEFTGNHADKLKEAAADYLFSLYGDWISLDRIEIIDHVFEDEAESMYRIKLIADDGEEELYLCSWQKVQGFFSLYPFTDMTGETTDIP